MKDLAVLCRSGMGLSSAIQLPCGTMYLYKCNKTIYNTLYEGGHFYDAMNLMVAMTALSSSGSHPGFADVGHVLAIKSGYCWQDQMNRHESSTVNVLDMVL